MIPVETMWMYVLTIALGVCFSVLTFYYAYLKIRPKFPIRVNCWFCDQYSVVPYDNRNCWDCVHCDQYNGFAGDGGYNKVIPAQHDELLNHSESAKASKKEKGSATKNVLCRKCSINQQLKVQQLATFSATNPNSFDQEVEEYRQHLERAYQLCSACERVLKQRLSQQQGWLLGLYRKELYSRKLKETSSNGSGRAGVSWEGRCSSLLAWAGRVLALAPLPVAPLLIGAHARSLAPTMLSPFFSADALWLLHTMMGLEAKACALGFLAMASAAVARMFRFHYRGFFASGAALSSVDVLAPMLWAAAAAHSYLLDTGALGEGVAVTDKALARLVLLVVVMALNVVAAFRPQDPFIAKPFQSTTIPSRTPTGSKVNGKRHMTEIFNSSSEESSEPSSPPPPPPPSLPPPSPCSFPAPASSSTPSSSSPPSLLSSFPSDAEELEWSLGRLRLGASPSASGGSSRRHRRSPWGRRSSSSAAAACALSSSPSPSSPSPLFRPARLALRHVTQASWVAGGYWGALGPPSPAPAPLSPSSGSAGWGAYGAEKRGAPLTEASLGALSRCSSQSSGFHSRSSASPGCASASLCGGASSSLDGACTASASLSAPPPVHCLQRPWPAWWWSPTGPAAAAAPWCVHPVPPSQCPGWGPGGGEAAGGASINCCTTTTPPPPSTTQRSLLSPWLVALCVACTFANAAVLCTAVVAFKDRLFA